MPIQQERKSKYSSLHILWNKQYLQSILPADPETSPLNIGEGVVIVSIVGKVIISYFFIADVLKKNHIYGLGRQILWKNSSS